MPNRCPRLLRQSPSGLLAMCGLLLASVALCAADDPPPKKVALLVGVNEYLKPGFDDLQFAEADVTAVGEELKKLGFEATVLLGSARDEQLRATKDNIERTTRRLVRPLGKQDVMLLMFSGHGQTLNPDPNADPNTLDLDKFESYYCPVDAVFNTPESQVSINHLLDDILAANVGRKLLIIDACRDVPEDRSRPGKNARGINLASIHVTVGTSVYMSCAFGQRSFEDRRLGHGLFTHCLLEGLRGGAARDGELAWADLVAHVNRRMQSEEILRLMPPKEKQLPFPAGDLTHTVLGRLEVRSPAGAPAVPVPAPAPGTSGQPDGELLIAPFTAQQAAAARAAAASRLGAPETTTNSIGMKLTLIPAGEFLMGSPPTEPERGKDEGPQHRVRISKPFYLGTYEVTQSQWQAVMGTNPSWFSRTGGGEDTLAGLNRSDFPVETVSWYDCVEFCNRLSEREGLSPCYTLRGIERNGSSIRSATVSIAGGNGYRLPTEGEWEYACRAGTTTPFHFGGINNGTQANVDGNSPYGTTTKGPDLGWTTSVGSYAPNGFGLYDMHGNVWEWCADWYDAQAYQSRSGTTSDPFVTSGEQKDRVLRGGSWRGFAGNSRSAVRLRNSPVIRYFLVGFRVARTP